jgi:uncharacterized protein with GYD domain
MEAMCIDFHTDRLFNYTNDGAESIKDTFERIEKVYEVAGR